MAGYHLTPIVKGTLGELSKIREEIEEASDAERQHCSVMVILELADAVGAIEAYLAKHHPSLSLDDLRIMASITKRAFDSGHRQSQDAP